MAQQPVNPTMNQKFDAPPPYFPEQVGMHQPPPPGFVQPTMTSTTTVITTEPILGPSHLVVTGYVLPQSHKSCNIQCPYCHADISTATSSETGMLTHLIAIILCVVV
ncbi:hypothetical protein Fcan01_13398 [Folsomia candida]|uniref:LITAF domain-containing protein n=2 Tax=Folsomia candida TaxID=158441 RepID=A0A226E531_FOLCA|nr:hypothetical protein Fcan01_13398 [Folsomia candida]